MLFIIYQSYNFISEPKGLNASNCRKIPLRTKIFTEWILADCRKNLVR